jgi:hypothetical protein
VKTYRGLAVIVALAAIVAGAAVVRWNSLAPAEAVRAGGSGSSWTLFGGIGSTGSGQKAGGKRPAIDFRVPTVKQYESGAFDLENLTVVKFVEKYRSAASENPDVAYRIFLAEKMCARVAEIERRQGRVLEDEVAACVGITPALMYERYQFLKQAAQGGVPTAARAFVQERPPGYTEDAPLPPEWRADAIKFLQPSGEHCDTDDLQTLAVLYVYLQSPLMPADQQKALTYYKAAAAVLRKPHLLPPPPNITILSDQWELEEIQTAIKLLSTGLSSEQIAVALQEGEAIAAQYCNKH